MSGAENMADLAHPRLAVLIPCFNNAVGLQRALDSLANDSESFDIVVVDDGSTPPLAVPKSAGDHRVLAHRLETNRGIEHALNAGLRLIFESGYEFVGRLDAGDVSLPGRLSAQLAFLDEHPDVAALGTALEWRNVRSEDVFVLAPPTDDLGIRRALRYNSALPHTSLVARVSALKEVGVYSDRFPAAEDYDLVLRLARKFKLANLPQPFVRAELDPSGISLRRRRRQLASRLRVQLHHLNPREIHGYLGLLTTLALFAVPNRLVFAAKKRLKRSPL